MKDFQITKNFKYSEFQCKDGTDVPIQLVPNLVLLAQQLEVLRAYLKSPIFINSAYRTEKYNKRVGGAENSYHLKAMASDIRVKNFTPLQIKNAILYLIENGLMLQGGIGLYKTFVHYDIRGFRARW